MERSNRAQEIVVFDIDGTLMPDTPDETSGRAFKMLNDRNVLHSSEATKQELSELYALAEENPLFTRQYHTAMFMAFDRDICGVPVREVKRVAQELADKDVSENLYPELRDEIDFWRDYGAKLAIVSGSPDVFVQAIKRRLNFDMATGTRHFRQGRMFHTAREVSSRARDKHLFVEKMRLRLGDQAIVTAAYGDTMNDLSMLKMAALPVVVNPKPDLHQVAAEHNWEVILTEKVA
jgi:HAD superfamily phosphoserine phosphatase-like hydrolase